MSEAEKQEGQKTVVAFIAGLLIGGLLVWVFSAPQEGEHMHDEDHNDEATETTEGVDIEMPATGDSSAENTPEIPKLPVGDGDISVANQPAGVVVALTSAEFPTADGWVAVRDWNGENVGGILGAARYSQSQGLIPTEVELLRATKAGETYAVVFFTEDGALTEAGKLFFDTAGDQQIPDILTTFTAE